jgi:hypothetical protein
VNQAEPDDIDRVAEADRAVSTFEDTISGWVSEGTVPRWPAGFEFSNDHRIAARTLPPEIPAPPRARATAAGHDVPPEPEPLPRPGTAPCWIGLALLSLGVLVLALPQTVGHNSTLTLPLSLTPFALGPALVIHGLLRRPPV